MANGVNIQIVVGNLGADAELAAVGANSTPRATFRVAATTRAGKDQEHTEWFSCVLWGTRASALAPHLTKGKRVAVTGETRTHSWEDEQGQAHYRTELVVRELTFQPQPSRGEPAQEPEAPGIPGAGGDDDVIPF